MFSVRNTCRPGVGGPILFIFFQKAILPIANLLLEATEQLTHTKVDNEGTCCSFCMKLQLTKKLFYGTYSNITYNILCRGKNILRKKKRIIIFPHVRFLISLKTTTGSQSGWNFSWRTSYTTEHCKREVGCDPIKTKPQEKFDFSFRMFDFFTQ